MNYLFLSNTNLFRGIKEDEIKTMLSCLNAYEREFKKDEIIYRAGDCVSEIGLVESGSVNIVVNFYWGNSNIFGHIETGKIFAETYAAVAGRELLVDVVAAEDCTILFLNMDKLLTVCQSGCSFHQRLIHNLLRISAMKNLNLSSRMMHTASKSTRVRLFSRQQLADYLGVERSALSNELSKMQKDGLIQYRKNEFKLLKDSPM